jgi:hypothetical protein
MAGPLNLVLEVVYSQCSVPVVVVMVIAIVATVIIVVPAIAVSVVVVIPVVVVLEPAAVSVPIAGKESLAIMMRRYPASAQVGRPGPITGMPLVVSSGRIPIALHPYEIRSRA